MAIVLIPAILYPKRFLKAIDEIQKNSALTRITGMIAMIMAFLFLSVHWKFTGGWYVLIPILGWAALLKGATRLLAPEWVYKMTKKWLKSETLISWMAFVGLLMAIGMTYVALYIY